MASATLPSFNAPPVIEVVLGAQFQPIAGLGVAHLGLLWQQFRKEYPKLEERPPLSHEVERIGIQKISDSMQISLQMVGVVPRIWMLTSSGEELIQVQQDRLVTNWRKNAAPKAEYPRYKNRKPDFVASLTKFMDFVKTEDLGDIVFDQCEVTYVNHIYPCEVWHNHEQLGNVFQGWARNYALPDAEAIGARIRHQIKDESGDFLGRLHIEIDSAYTRTKPDDEYKPIFAMKLIARGKPMSDGLKGVIDFLDLGHDTIVTGFTAITTPEMHSQWGRTK